MQAFSPEWGHFWVELAMAVLSVGTVTFYAGRTSKTVDTIKESVDDLKTTVADSIKETKDRDEKQDVKIIDLQLDVRSLQEWRDMDAPHGKPNGKGRIVQ